MPWVKFHESLTKGAKRGIKRAYRMVYMELSLACRPKRGFVELPLGMSDEEGVCDLLGGDAREVRDALRVLTSGSEPMVTFDGPSGSRRLLVTSWQKHNTVELHGASTERSRRSRGSDEPKDSAEKQHSEAIATVMQRSLHDVAPVERNGVQRSCNDDATGCNDRSSGDQIREEKKERSEPDPDGSPEPVGSAHSSPTVMGVWAAYLDGRKRNGSRGAEPVLNDKRKRLIRARIKDHGVEVVEAAARGIWLHPWNREKGETSIDLAMRDATHIERFAPLGGISRKQPNLFDADAVPRNDQPTAPKPAALVPTSLEELRAGLADMRAKGVEPHPAMLAHIRKLEAEQAS